MESNPSWGARLQKAEAFKALPKSWPWSLQRSTLLSMPWRSSLPLMHCWPAVLQWALYPLMYRNSKEQETRSWRPAAGCTTFQKMTTCGGWSPSIICSSIWLLRLRPNKAAPTSIGVGLMNHWEASFPKLQLAGVESTTQSLYLSTSWPGCLLCSGASPEDWFQQRVWWTVKRKA